MRQRNPGPYTYDLPTLGVRLLPGEEIDHPDALAGCVPVNEDGEIVASSGDRNAKEVI